MQIPASPLQTVNSKWTQLWSSTFCTANFPLYRWRFENRQPPSSVLVLLSFSSYLFFFHFLLFTNLPSCLTYLPLFIQSLASSIICSSLTLCFHLYMQVPYNTDIVNLIYHTSGMKYTCQKNVSCKFWSSVQSFANLNVNWWNLSTTIHS